MGYWVLRLWGTKYEVKELGVRGMGMGGAGVQKATKKHTKGVPKENKGRARGVPEEK